ncbi:MAG TPA: hypothetical protein VHK47_07780 [Polyangia bacterium]|jgi:hypothetical protein|nr:hypothetical protein [Polyangia bacterium]
MGERAANAVIGIWLFCSPFFWFHSLFQRANAWVSGMVVVTAAVSGLGGDRSARYVNAAVGGWLIISAILPVGQSPPTFWNQLVCGFLLAVFALGVSRGWTRRAPITR